MKGANYLRDEIDRAIELSRGENARCQLVPVYLDGIPANTLDHVYGLGNLTPIDASAQGVEGVAHQLKALLRAPSESVSTPTQAASHPHNDLVIQPEPLRGYFDHLISSHTRLFAGREKELRRIRRFIERERRGYIFIEGLSGYGKTSLLAKLVQEQPAYVYHFISQAYCARDASFDPTTLDSLARNLWEQVAPEHAAAPEGSSQNRLRRLLRESPTASPRIIVLDAVDELSPMSSLYGLLPPQLPEQVFVIFSARTLGDNASALNDIGLSPRDLGLLVKLPGFDPATIGKLLRAAGGLARGLARSTSFVRQLWNVSEGDPFYTRFLVEDVADGKITPHNISATPRGLHGYLDLQLSLLDRSAHRPQQRAILGYILSAMAPLSRGDLIGIAESNGVMDLDWMNFDTIIKDIRRFLLVHKEQFTFCHRRFKEYFETRLPAR